MKRAAAGRPGRSAPERAAALLAVAALAAVLCSGCSQFLSIGRQGVILGVAVDAGPGPDVTATLQMYHHGGSTGQTGGAGGGGGGAGGGGAGGGSPSQPVVLTLQGSGPDFAQAVQAAQGQTDVRVGFWATDLVLVGEGLARSGLRPPLDALLRDGDFSLRAQLAVVEGEAGKMLQAPQPGGSALEIGERLDHSESTNTGSIPIPFWRFMSRLSTPYNAAWAPVLVETPQGYRAAGTAVFRGGVLGGVLGVRRSRALSWLLQSGAFKPLTLPAPGGSGTVTLDVIGRRKHLRLDGPGVGTITLTLSTLVQQGPGISLRAAPSSRDLEQAAAVAATRELRAAVDSLQASGADVIGFGALERQRDPAAVADWPAVFSRMHLTLDVTVRVYPGGRLA